MNQLDVITHSVRSVMNCSTVLIQILASKSLSNISSTSHFCFQEHAIGKGTGTYNGHRLFTTKMDHAALLPVDVLIRAEDYNYDNGKGDTSILENLSNKRK